MAQLKECFQLTGKQVVSVIGSGGKTSLIRYLAEVHKHQRVLSSTTTKIGFPKEGTFDCLITEDFEQLYEGKQGITIAGNPCVGNYKLEMPDSLHFQKSFSSFDKVFLEADGSKQLPLKGWATFEPVVLPETTCTIGVIPLSVIGRAGDEGTIHRFPIFQEITGINASERITAKHLAAVLTHRNGLWREAKGERILFLSQLETESQLAQGKQLIASLADFEVSKLSKIITGNTKTKEGIVLWSK